MNLLCFAHYGEAQTFIQELGGAKHTSRQNFFKTRDADLILVTGEGYLKSGYEVLEILCENPSVNRVYNLGICGGLERKYDLKSIHPIELVTLYLESPQYESFETSQHGLNLVTCINRVYETKTNSDLLAMGDVVDREAWGIAKACKKRKIPFYAHKMISDYVGETYCHLIKEEAKKYSDKLYDYFYNLPKEEKSRKTLTYPARLHFSFTQKHQYKDLHNKALLKKISLKEKENLLLNELKEKGYPPKKESKVFLNELKDFIFPEIKMFEKNYVE